MPLAGVRVYIHGRIRGLTQRRVMGLVAAAGGTVTRRGASAGTIAIGHSTAAALSNEGELALGFEPMAGADFLSENTFRRSVGLSAGRADESGTYSFGDLERLSGLSARQLRSLLHYDVLTGTEGRLGYGDLVAARAVARLLSSGVSFGRVVAAALALNHRGASLSGARLTQAPWGEVLQEIEGQFARLDGQLLLPVSGEDIVADEAFASAERSEDAGDLAAAERWYELAARLDRTDAIIPFNLANVLDARGRSREAEMAYRQAIGRNPHFADAWFNLGVLQERGGRKEEALSSYREAFRLEPGYGDAIHNAAALLMDMRRFDEALPLWERIAAASPEGAREAKRLAHLCRLQIRAASVRR